MSINARITWQMAVPLYIQAIKQGSKGRYAERAFIAEQELLRLAREVDRLNGLPETEEVVTKKRKRKKHNHIKGCDVCGKACKGTIGLAVHKAKLHGKKGVNKIREENKVDEWQVLNISSHGTGNTYNN